MNKIVFVLSFLLAAIMPPLIITAIWRPWQLRLASMPLWVATTHDVAYGPAAQQKMDIMRPRRSRATPFPAVVVFHGGGWLAGSRLEVRERVCRRYLAHGFVVASVDYRWGVVAASEDAVRALDFFASHARDYGSDAHRIVVTGESAGGHLALLSAFTSKKKIAAIINFQGIPDLVPLLGTWWVREAIPEPNRTEIGERFSPIHMFGLRFPFCPYTARQTLSCPAIKQGC